MWQPLCATALTRLHPHPQQQLLLNSPSYNKEVEDLLFGYFVAFCRHSYAAQLAAYERAVATLDLRAPHAWYPYARAIHRKIVYHGGGSRPAGLIGAGPFCKWEWAWHTAVVGLSQEGGGLTIGKGSVQHLKVCPWHAALHNHAMQGRPTAARPTRRSRRWRRRSAASTAGRSGCSPWRCARARAGRPSFSEVFPLQLMVCLGSSEPAQIPA